MVSEGTASLNMFPLSVIEIGVLMKKFILEHRHPISRHKTLSRVSASIANHNSFQLNDFFSGSGKFVKLDDFIRKVWDIDPCITLSSHVEVIFLEVREFFKECQQCLKVELCH